MRGDEESCVAFDGLGAVNLVNGQYHTCFWKSISRNTAIVTQPSNERKIVVSLSDDLRQI